MVPLATKNLDTTAKHKTEKKNTSTSVKEQCIENQDQNCGDTNGNGGDYEEENVLREFVQTRVLHTVYEEEEQISWGSPDTIKESEHIQSVSLHLNSSTEPSTPFKQLLESTPNHLVQTKDFQRNEKTSPLQSASNFIRNFTKSTLSPVSKLSVLQLLVN